MIRVLHIIEKMDRGGAETLIMNLYREIDKKNVQFDFVVHETESGHFDKEIISLGGKIYPLPKPSSIGMKEYQLALSELLQKNGPFHAVHSHIHYFSGVIMKVAKKQNVPVRIAHSHTSADFKKESIVRTLYKGYMRNLILANATLLFYCSDKAGKALLGNKFINDKRSVFIPNSVNLELFINGYEQDKHTLRKTLNIPTDKQIVGHVGSFTKPKNHVFLIKIFQQLLKESDNYHLVLVGGGPLRRETEELVKEYKIERHVTFYGVTDDVPSVIQSFDMVLFPSLFEGLPTVIVEAQAAGVPIVMSENITDEVNMDLGILAKVNLDESTEIWVKQIRNTLLLNKPSVEEIKNNIYSKGFSTNQVAKLCEGLYLNGSS
jgi:glycosyltransferase EpsF